MKEMKYVAFEGGEGAGKSTVSREVAEALRRDLYNLEVVEVKEPGGTDVGEEIRRTLLGSGEMDARTETLLFAASRAELIARVVKPALERGAAVVSDRSVYSSLAYQGVARGLGVAAVQAVNAFALNLLFPECVVYLSVDTEAGLTREKEVNRLSKAGVEFQEKVRRGYDRLIKERPNRFVIIDASKPLETVVKESVDALALRWGL